MDMGQFFSSINNFLNDEQIIKVLYFLVLLMALVWLLSGGFRFLNKKSKNEAETSNENEKRNKK
jgi:hypothetical protein